MDIGVVRTVLHIEKFKNSRAKALNNKMFYLKKNKGEKTMKKIEEIRKELEERKDRSAWNKGVTVYALELLEVYEGRADYEGRDAEDRKEFKEWIKNGADSWEGYSWGGSSLIYNGDIADRLCCPSELKKTRNGERRPNNREEWLDVQARALYQASKRLLNVAF
jgi:hypothetical protein